MIRENSKRPPSPHQNRGMQLRTRRSPFGLQLHSFVAKAAADPDWKSGSMPVLVASLMSALLLLTVAQHESSHEAWWQNHMSFVTAEGRRQITDRQFKEYDWKCPECFCPGPQPDVSRRVELLGLPSMPRGPASSAL